MNKLKKGLMSFGFIVILGVLVAQGLVYQRYFHNLTLRTFEPTPEQLFAAAFSILIGVYLALPQIIKQKSVPGKWQVDWVKLISIGLPCLYFALLTLVIFGLKLDWLPFRTVPIVQEDFFSKLAGIIFGYVLVSSFHKKKLEE